MKVCILVSTWNEAAPCNTALMRQATSSSSRKSFADIEPAECFPTASKTSTTVTSLPLSSDVTDVFWWGRELASLESSYLSIKKDLRRHAKKNAIPSEDLNNLFSKIHFVTELSDLGGCDVYIEAIVMIFKQKLHS